MRPYERPAQRFGVLPLNPGYQSRYVIFDCETARIIDGVYFRLDLALDVAARCAQVGEPLYDDMTPTAEALGLLFPAPSAGDTHA